MEFPRPIPNAPLWTEAQNGQVFFDGEERPIYEPQAYLVLPDNNVIVLQGHEELKAFDLRTGDEIARTRTR